MGITTQGCSASFWSEVSVLNLTLQWWLQTSVHVLQATELYVLNINFMVVNYLSIKLLRKSYFQTLWILPQSKIFGSHLKK